MSKLYLIKSYIKYISKAKNAHGTHSPFVYDLLTQCFYDKICYSEYNVLKSFRKNVLKDQSLLEIVDFGEGSKIFKSNSRKVADIAKNAGMSSRRQKLLFRISKYFQSENILELGTSVGLATAALALSNRSSKIISIEGCPETAKSADGFFHNFDLPNIALRNQSFEDYFSETQPNDLDLVFVDGNHNKEKTLEYFNFLLPSLHNDSVVIFDDIYWSKEMTTCWEQIISHPKVTVSIDTFQWGIVFFRKEQRKQHFVLRV